MKLLFLSDLQLEAGAAFGTGEFGPGSRFQDQVVVLGRIAGLAVEEGVAVVGVLGDVFERSRPAPWAVLAFQWFVRAMQAVDIHVLVVSGNHDVRSAALPSALSIFDGDGVDVALTPSLYPVAFDDYGEGGSLAVIAALPWTPISRLVAAQPDLSRGQLNDLAAAALAESAQVLGARCADEYPDACPILVGHWAISGATLPTGLATDMLNEPVIPVDGLTSAGFRAVVFGHIHQVQAVAAVPPVVYCGSPMVCNWGEAATPHGCWIYDTEGDGKLSFKAIADRPFVTLDLDYDADAKSLYLGDENAALLTANPGALVRARYSVTEEQAREISEADLRAFLVQWGARKVFIKATVARAARARVAEVAEGIDDSAAFELWLTSQDVPETDRQALRDLHAGYVEASRA